MDKRYVMDNIKLNGLYDAHTKSKSAGGRALAATALLMSSVALTGGVSAETISINASQNPENKIELTGDFKPSVEVTTDGLKIEIPGVNITLTCEGAEVGEETPCTLNLAAGGGNGDGSGDGNGDGSGDGNGDGSGNGNGDGSGDGNGDGSGDGNGDGSGDGNGDGSSDGNGEGDENKYTDFCAAGRDAPFGNKDLFDRVCNEDGTVKEGEGGDGAGNDGGFVTNPDTGAPTDPDPCGVGFNPSCSGSGDGVTTDPAPTRDLFRDSRAIVDYSVDRPEDYTIPDDGEVVDFGTAGVYGTYGRKRTVKLPKGKVGVIGFTLAPPTTLADYCAAGEGVAQPYFSYDGEWDKRCNNDGTPLAGEQPQQRLDRNKLRLSFSESTTQAGGKFHLWLSEEKDGDPIANCGFSTFPEGKWLLTVGINSAEAAEDCNLEEGKPYFMMVAFCETSEEDVNCKAADAKTGLRDGNMSLDPGWYMAQ